jgi:hypothetical protein
MILIVMQLILKSLLIWENKVIITSAYSMIILLIITVFIVKEIQYEYINSRR